MRIPLSRGVLQHRADFLSPHGCITPTMGKKPQGMVFPLLLVLCFIPVMLCFIPKFQKLGTAACFIHMRAWALDLNMKMVH